MSTLSPARPTSAYGQLLAEVTAARLLERSPSLYTARAALLVVLTGSGAAVMVVLGNSWWQLAAAVFFAAVFAQLGFLGHDAGHQQIFRSRRANEVAGFVFTSLGIGLSHRWWVDKHNRHHRAPNQVGLDPDVGPGVLSWTGDQAEGQRGVLRWIASHQAGIFFPLLLLEAWSLHVGSFRAVVARRATGEAALLLLHVMSVMVALSLMMSPVKVLTFVVVQQCLFGLYLGCSFAPNHKGMPLTEAGCPGERDFLRRQVLTARNVAGGRLLTSALGGLNYQIEHHLFPSMPSRNLRRCQPIVRRFCRDHGLVYVESGLIRAYAESLRYLRQVRPLTASTLSTGAIPSF